jgi:uncharacterized repeat protein (TIGR01451 family)
MSRSTRRFERCRRAVVLGAAAALLGAPLVAARGASAEAVQLAQGARATVSEDGLRVEQQPGAEGGWSWDLRLRAHGRGGRTRAVERAAGPGDGGRLEYQRGPLREWYVRAGLGVEQGFTVGERPAGSGMLVLEFDLATELSGTLSPDARSAAFATPAGTTLHYAGLLAYDARGAALPARLVLAPGRLGIEVDDGRATYPVTIDPLVYMEAKQVAFDASADDHFGAAVAVDGDTAVVGAPDDDDPTAGDGTGAAYVFVRSGAAWVLQQKLTAGDMAAGDAFGAAVSISGERIVVGAPGDDDAVAGADAGSAYVFTRSGEVWSEDAKLLAPDLAASDELGASVAVFLDTVVVGAPAGDGGAADSGAAYVFVYDALASLGTRWPFEAELNASDAAVDDGFGASVSLDGETAVVGAPGNDDGGAQSGSAYVFVRSGTLWSEEQKLVASDDNAGDEFGRSVGVSGDTAVVGAPMDDTGNGVEAGSVYVFSRADSTWTQQDRIESSNADDFDHFGQAVAISSDAVAVGAPDDGNAEGEVVVFARTGTQWPQILRLRASDRENDDLFGASLALSGGSLAVGAPQDDDLIADQGGAYLHYAYEEDVDLEVAKSVSNPEPSEGSTVVFTVAVTNWGNDDARVVAISDPFPEGLVFVDSLASRGTYNVNTGLWQIGTLPRYSAASLTITAQVPIGSAGLTVTNTATLLAFDATPDDNAASVVVHVGAPGPSSSWQNLDFELDAAPADGQPDGWQLKTNAATDLVDCTTASSGSCSFMIVGAKKKAKKIFQSLVDENPAGGYTFSLYAKADGVTGVPKAKVLLTYAGGGKAKVELALGAGTYDWTLYNAVVTATKPWKSAKVIISWKGTGTLHVDDLTLPPQ